MPGVFAGCETSIRQERQRGGIEPAKRRGIYRSRKQADETGRGTGGFGSTWVG
jgi:DNA invertase Pin-like site-specific DNA recombinase